MSGHSKWSTIKHKKAAADAKRGKVFTKLVKEITVAARDGGGDPAMNARLKLAAQTAKDNNMPAENIDRAIKKGTGELPGITYTDVLYEGYGPNGIALLIEALTDNKNRTTPEIRKIFSKRGGSLGENGCVAWMFKSQAFITISNDKVEEENLMDILLEAGLEDLQSDDSQFSLYGLPESLDTMKTALGKAGIAWETAEITKISNSDIAITEPSVAKQILGLMEEIEDHDDVQHVYANFDIDTALLEAL